MDIEDKAFELLLNCPIGLDCLDFDNPKRMEVHEKFVGFPCPSDPIERIDWIFSTMAKYRLAWVDAHIKELNKDNYGWKRLSKRT